MAASIGRMIEILELPEVRELYNSTIRKMQPVALVRRLESEKVSTNGEMPELRGRLLRLEIRKMQPKLDVPWYPEDDVPEECRKITDLGDASTSASTATKAAVTQSACNTFELPNRIQNDTLPNVSKDSDPMKLDDPISTEKPLDNDTIEKKRIDYLLSCMKLLKSWNLQYSGERGQKGYNFLDALTDFRKFSNIDDRTLFLMLPSIFTDEAKTWYRMNYFTSKSWDQFDKAFIEHITIRTQTPPRSRMYPLGRF